MSEHAELRARAEAATTHEIGSSCWSVRDEDSDEFWFARGYQSVGPDEWEGDDWERPNIAIVPGSDDEASAIAAYIAAANPTLIIFLLDEIAMLRGHNEDLARELDALQHGDPSCP